MTKSLFPVLESSKTVYFKNYLDYILVGIIFLIASIPLLTMGFCADDMLNTLVKGVILDHHVTLFAYIGKRIIAWLHNGRLFPVTLFLVYTYAYLFGTSLILYNFFHWCSVIISYYLTCVFLKKLNFSTNNRLLFICLLPFCWSLFPGTPLVSFSILLPALAIMVMLVFINYINFLNTKRMRYCVGAIIFSLLAFLTYEISVVIIPAILLLNKYCEGKFFAKNKAMWLIFLVACLYLVTVLMARHIFVVSYEGIALGDPGKIPFTFLKQLYGSWPLWYFFPNKQFFVRAFYNFPWQTYVLALLLMVGSFAVLSRLLRNTNSLYIAQSKWIFFISIILQVIPAFVLSLAKQYQEATLLYVHIPVFLQQIGFVIMLIAILQYLLNRPKLSNVSVQFYLRSTLALFIAVITGLSFLTNTAFSNFVNQYFQYPRDIYLQALSQGLSNQLPQNAVVLKPSWYVGENGWNNKYFFKLYFDRNDLIVYNFTQNEPKLNLSLKNNVFYLDFKSVICNAKCGYVFFAQVASVNGALPHAQLKLEHVQIFYTATSWRDKKKVLRDINRYLGNDPQLALAVNTLINQQSSLSGLVKLPSHINFYWRNSALVSVSH